MGESSLEIRPPERVGEKRLDSWKEIASYLNRDVTTVQRWEKREGMPVHRHLHDKRGSVYALSGELDSWLQSRGLLGQAAVGIESSGSDEAERRADSEPAAIADDRETAPARVRWRWALAALLLVGALAVAYFTHQYRARVAAQPRIQSLAVLPLRNLSGDASQDYLADGITEALIGRLAGIRDLHVISHTSVMRFKNSQLSVPEIVRTLGVDAVVEGSVVREGSRIRITAQLIRGATDEHFWSETYDREMRDALSLESELAKSIAEKVRATVTGQEHLRLTATRPVAPKVYESYLKGMFALDQGNTRASVEESIAHFEDAIKQDSTFAPAYLGLAQAYTDLGSVFVGVQPAETRPKVMNAARRALELDPDLAEAHVVLANALQEEWQWAEAETEYQRALELAPNDAGAHAGIALWLLCQDARTRRLPRSSVPGSWIRLRSQVTALPGCCSSHIATRRRFAKLAARWRYGPTMHSHCGFWDSC
jgi:TolB-like protein